MDLPPFYQPVTNPKLNGLWCRVRGKHVQDTAEERVRQSLLHALTQDFGYPPDWLLVERPVHVPDGRRLRSDIEIRVPRELIPTSSGDQSLSGHTGATEGDAVTNRTASGSAEGRVAEVLRHKSHLQLFFSAVAAPQEIRFLGKERKTAGWSAGPSWPGISLRIDAGDGEYLTAALLQPVPRRGQGPLMTVEESDLSRRILGSIPSIFSPKKDDVVHWYGEWFENLSLVLEPVGLLVVSHYLDRANSGFVLVVDQEYDGGGYALLRVKSQKLVAQEAKKQLARDEAQFASLPLAKKRLRTGSYDVGADFQTLLVVECKGQQVDLTEDTRSQGLRYAEARGAPFLCLYNGDQIELWLVKDGEPMRVKALPTLEDLKRGVSIEPYEETNATDWREPFRQPRDSNALYVEARLRKLGLPIDQWLPGIRVQDALRTPADWTHAELSGLGLTMVSERRRSWRGADTRSGHLYGWYRNFAVRDREGTEWDAGVYFRPGDSRLCVAVAEDGRFRPALSTNFTRILYADEKTSRYLHDGTFSHSKRDYRRADLLQLIRERLPGLPFDGSRVLLGELPLLEAPTRAQESTFLVRLLGYAIFRAAYRSQVDQGRRPLPLNRHNGRARVVTRPRQPVKKKFWT